MSGSVEQLLERRKGCGVFIDTNILLLYSFGSHDPRLVSSFKRTRQFTQEDFDLLLRLTTWFGSILTTPHVLAEVNSLAGQLGHNLRRQWRSSFRNQFEGFREETVSSRLAIESPQFLDVGLTDSTILECARAGVLVLTDDLQLYLKLIAEGLDSINFNHLRTTAW